MKHYRFPALALLALLILTLACAAPGEQPTAAPITTDTPLPPPSPTATARPTATSTPIPSPTPLPTSFGPADGSLALDPAAGPSESIAGVSLADFYVKATFSNPFPTALGIWDYGFVFRSSDAMNQYRLVIDSTRRWALQHVRRGEVTTVQEGQLTGLKRGAEDANELKLVAIGEDGYLICNDVFISVLDLSWDETAGGVGVASGFEGVHAQEGYATAYQGFLARSLAPIFGPRSGSMPHDDDSEFEYVCGYADVVDFVASATFYVPHSGLDWDIAFRFRQTEEQEFEWTVLTVAMWTDWTLVHVKSQDLNRIQWGEADGERLGEGQTNELVLIVDGVWGYAFLNGRFQGRLDLSAGTNKGDVCVATGMYYGSEVVGSQTRYDDFTIRMIR
jgi:hypothetical protein